MGNPVCDVFITFFSDIFHAPHHHVLMKVYDIDRVVVANTLIELFTKKVVGSHDSALTIKALTVFVETKLDFIDCLLIAHRLIYDIEVQSFDKKMNSYLKRQL